MNSGRKIKLLILRLFIAKNCDLSVEMTREGTHEFLRRDSITTYS